MRDQSKCRKVSSDRYDTQRLHIPEACNCEGCLESHYADTNVQGKHAPKSFERNGSDGERAASKLGRKLSPKEAKVKFMSTEEAISLAKSGTCERPRTFIRSSSNRKQKSLRAIYNHVTTESSRATIGNQQASSPIKLPSVLNRETPANTSSETSNGQLNVKSGDERRLLTSVQTESCIIPMPLILVLDPNLPNAPVHEACWKGTFDVFPTNSHIGVQAHFSSKLFYKAYDIKNHMPEILKLVMVCSKDVWPKSFQQDLPTADDIALYFFPCESSERYISLVEHIKSGDFALKARITDIELLIFTSERLFAGSKDWLLSGSPVKNYLWGVFRHKHKSRNCYKQAHPLSSKSKMVNDIEEETTVTYDLNSASKNASYEDICHPKVHKIKESIVPETPTRMIDDLNPSHKFENSLHASYEDKSHPEPQKVNESTVPATPPGFLPTDAYKRNLEVSRLPASSSQFLPKYYCKNIPKESTIPATPPGFLIPEAYKKYLPTALPRDNLIKDDMIEEKDIKPIGVILDSETYLKTQKSRHLAVSTSLFGTQSTDTTTTTITTKPYPTRWGRLTQSTDTCIKNQKELVIPASPPGFLPTSDTSKDGNRRGFFLSKQAAVMTEVGHDKYMPTSHKTWNSKLNLLGNTRIEVKKERGNQMK